MVEAKVLVIRLFELQDGHFHNAGWTKEENWLINEQVPPLTLHTSLQELVQLGLSLDSLL